MAKMFGRDYLAGVFGRIGSGLEAKVSAFVLGGGAMCFRNQKTGTKDIDLVFRNGTEARRFVKCALKERFAKPSSLGNAYRMMKAFDILEDADGFRLDIFSKAVCGALRLSRDMTARAERFGTFGKLEIFLVSNEDVVLFKGITERERDADDIAAVIRASKIDWSIILQECIAQSKATPWYGLLYNKLVDIEEKHGITVPIAKEVLKLDRAALVKNAYETRIKGGMRREEAMADLRKKGFKKKELEDL